MLYKFFRQEDTRPNRAQDQNVLREAASCDNYNFAENVPAILTRHIRKVYRLNVANAIVAVSDVSFSTKVGECFALLGTNGAGKTTTFKMLTNDVTPTKGEILIFGQELTSNFSRIRRMIGYSPQYEAGFMQLTVRENLEFYAKIKSIPEVLRGPLVNKVIAEMQLSMYENVECGQLSGGNKRKLTASIALLGNPPILLLDEPSTGVDPQAKRFMWKMIERVSIKNQKTAVILTTHSMEEAEALCTKMAIMVGGNFKCIGSPQELRGIFGKGYEIQINVKQPTEEDIIQLLGSFNLDSRRSFFRQDLINFFNAVQLPEMVKEINPNGWASEFDRELSFGNSIQAASVAHFVIIEKRGRDVAYELAKVFGDVKVPEHYNNYFKFRVEKRDESQTIGLLFTMIQDMCNYFPISDYSASQTTLSQIFHTFVQQAEVRMSYLII